MNEDEMDERPEDALVEDVRRGRTEAFSELARRHQQRIYRLIYGMTRNHSDADDLSQEVLMTAFRSIAGFRGTSGFYTWIYRIAVNRTLNFLRERGPEKDRAEFREDFPCTGAQAGESSPESCSIRDELRSRMAEAVDSLPPIYRSSFLLVIDQGLSHAEAARALGCSENTISWRLHKARKMLQARLRPYLNEVGP
jgi:RNA polymerase sigma-70 factor (ECF subfamily)